MVPLQFVRVSGKELQIPLLPLHVAKGPLLSGRHPRGLHWRGSLQGLRGLRGLRESRGSGCRSLRRLRGLGSWWCDFFDRHRLGRLWLVFAAGRTASSLGLRGLDGHGFRSRLRGRLFSSRRRSLVHHGGFCILSHLSYSRKSIFIIEEHAKRNAGSASIHRVPVHIGELKPKRTESNGSVEFHEMPFVRSG